MKNLLCCAMLLLAGILIFVSHGVKAQSGNVIYLGAMAGTTLAANCPAIPAVPSVCVVGDGVWLWQSATLGWYKPSAGVAITGVTSVTANGIKLTGDVILPTIPTKVTVTSTGALQ